MPYRPGLAASSSKAVGGVDTFKKFLKGKGINPAGGRVVTKPGKGHANDIMGSLRGKVPQRGIDALAKSAAIIVRAEPGDIVLDKSGAQNMIGGAPLTLVILPGKKARADGLVAYCTDETRPSPGDGSVFDVLGPARDQPGDGMAELQRVAEIIAQRQELPFSQTAGGLYAIYRVTDNESTFPEPATADILRAAGIPLDPTERTFQTPHFSDPNAGSPDTGAVTPSGVLAPLQLPPGPPARPEPKPKLKKLRAKVEHVRRVRMLVEIGRAHV